MKRFFILYAVLCVCAAVSCGRKNAAEVPSGEMRFMDLSAVHAQRSESPSTETFMSLTIGFRGGDVLEKEIRSKEERLVKAASAVGAGVGKEDLTDVERYEQLRNRLIAAFNGELSRPAVVKVIIRDIKVR